MSGAELQYWPDLPARLDTPIGCVGAGFIMRDSHLTAYRGAGFNPVAIFDPNREARERAAARHRIPRTCDSLESLLANEEVEVLDVAVPPDVTLSVVERAVAHAGHIRGILAQKPLGRDLAEARRIVALCRQAGITLAVNQNMRFDQSVRACRDLLRRGALGEPVLATLEMRAIPHWMPWQERQGWCTLRVMSIHHLDTFRYWFGDPDRIYASLRPDPRTKFAHTDGIVLYTLEYDQTGLRAAAWDDVWAGPAREGAAGDIYIRWRLEGERGLARGTIGWPSYPERCPSTLDWSTLEDDGAWHSPRWNEVWFPDSFAGPMADLLIALERGAEPPCSGDDNLSTLALVEAAYESARRRAAVSPKEFLEEV